MRLVGLRLRDFCSRQRPRRRNTVRAPSCRSARLSADDVAEIVQAMGLDPIGPPVRSGPFFVQRARG